MSYAAVTFSADVLDQGHSEFVLVQNGVDTGSLDERVWAPGVAQTEAPTSESTYELTGIRALGGTVTADGPRWFWIVPKVKFVLSAAGLTPSVEVSVSGAPGHNSDNVYPLSVGDHVAIEAFLLHAKFPPGP